MKNLEIQLISFSTLVHVFGFLVALPTHLGDPTWSAHAQFHHVLAWFWLLGLSGLLLLLVRQTIQKRELWSYWAALGGFILAHGSFYLTMLLVWEGRPTEAWQQAMLIMNTLIGAVGFFLLWRSLNFKRTA
jgi:hypothetical protein